MRREAAVSERALQPPPGLAAREDDDGGVRVVRVNNTFRDVRAFADTYRNAGIRALAGRLLEEVRPQVVHFDQNGETGRDVFSIKCGPCHRVLTERWGGLGRGDAGPNLSGLLTSFYPKSFKTDGEWNAERLRRWLENLNDDDLGRYKM